MDAVKYLRERERICDMYECGDCPLFEMDCDGVRHIEESVALVEKWSAENPIRTRADVFREMFPNGELFNFCCPKYTTGGECEDYGYHESEENCCDCCQAYWYSPAPEDFGKGGAK